MTITREELDALWPDPPDDGERQSDAPAREPERDTTITIPVRAVRAAVAALRPQPEPPARAAWLDDPYSIEWALQLEQREAQHFFDVVETVYERTAWLRARLVDEQAERIADLERKNAALRQELESLREAVRELVSNVEDVYLITIPVMELARSGALMPFEFS